MKSLLPIATILLTLGHLIIYSRSWTMGAMDISSLLPDAPPKNLMTLTIACFMVTTLGITAFLFKTKRLVVASLTSATLILAIAIYLSTPLIEIVSPTMIIPLTIGLFLGILIIRLRLFTQNHYTPTTALVSPLSYVLLALNALLIIAHSASLAPTGFAEEVPWHPENLEVRHSDSVATSHNLLFYGIRATISLITGNTIMLNTIVSIILCSVGIGLLSFCAQRIAGTAVGILTLTMIVTERWSMTTAFAGNLPSSLIACSGLAFFAICSIFFADNQNKRYSGIKLGILVFFTTIIALYSYAAVRMPFILSMIVIIFLQLTQGEQPLLHRAIQSFLRIVLPAILAVFSVLLFAYHGDAAHMRKHLLVSWPQENIRPNPGPDGIKDFILVHNPDIPVWKQIARPADGGNISLIWTRSPSQTLTAIGKHLQSIADNTPEFFPLQPLVFTLAILALIRAPLLPQKARWGIYCAAIWSCIWITSFLLVPDAVAYRRGVAFSTTFALLAGLSLYGANLKTKRGAAIFLLGAMIIATRFPYELSFANQDQARSRMYTICNISAPARVLLKSPILGSIDSTETVLLVARIEGERELSCQSNLANSAEWKKFRPNSRALIVEPDSVGTELKKLDPFTKIITYCSPETRKVLEIKAICDDTSQLVKSVAEIKIPNASDPLLWRVVSLRANPD